MAVRRIHDAGIAQVQSELGGGVADLALGTDQDGPQQAQVAGLQRGRQRGLVARVGDGARGRLQRLRARDESVVVLGRGQAHGVYALEG
ncbi:hypothetical protein D3C85_461460 [compost metagenome]